MCTKQITELQSTIDWTKKHSCVFLDAAIAKVHAAKTTALWTKRERAAFQENLGVYVQLLEWIDHANGGNDPDMLMSCMHSTVDLEKDAHRRLPYFKAIESYLRTQPEQEILKMIDMAMKGTQPLIGAQLRIFITWNALVMCAMPGCALPLSEDRVWLESVRELTFKVHDYVTSHTPTPEQCLGIADYFV